MSVHVFEPTVLYPGNSSHWNSKFVYSLFLAPQKLDFNEDKLEHLSGLQKLIQTSIKFYI